MADFNINQGDICSIIEPKIRESCNVNSVWKAVDMAIACTASDPTNRPTMNQVVSKLQECLYISWVKLRQRPSSWFYNVYCLDAQQRAWSYGKVVEFVVGYVWE